MTNCARIEAELSAYLDGELATDRRCTVLRHLEQCGECAARAHQMRLVSDQIRQLPAPAAPRHLALRLRVSASHYAVRSQRLEFWQLRLQALFRAMAVPVLAGTMGAVCLFAFMFGSVSRSVMAAAAIADVPLPLSAPPRLINPAELDVSRPLLIQVDIDSLGRVDGYRVLSGPQDPEVISRLNNALLLSVFQPATILGEPTSGRVLLSFDTVTVHVGG